MIYITPKQLLKCTWGWDQYWGALIPSRPSEAFILAAITNVMTECDVRPDCLAHPLKAYRCQRDLPQIRNKRPTFGFGPAPQEIQPSEVVEVRQGKKCNYQCNVHLMGAE